MPDQSFAISDLRSKPEFFDTLVDRVWREWWKPNYYPLSHTEFLARDLLTASPISFALVAHEGEIYRGSVLVIASDMAERPQYTPWIAALWVDPSFREEGIGAALVDQAVLATRHLGIPKIYLSATRARRNFYLKRGWQKIEEDVGEHALTILTL